MSKASAYAAAWQRYWARPSEEPNPGELEFKTVGLWAKVHPYGGLSINGESAGPDIPALIAWLTDTFTDSPPAGEEA